MFFNRTPTSTGRSTSLSGSSVAGSEEALTLPRHTTALPSVSILSPPPEPAGELTCNPVDRAHRWTRTAYMCRVVGSLTSGECSCTGASGVSVWLQSEYVHRGSAFAKDFWRSGKEVFANGRSRCTYLPWRSPTVTKEVPMPARRPDRNPLALPQLLDMSELAARLSTTERHVRRLVDERRIPFVRVGRFIRFDPAQVAAWLDEQVGA